MVKEKLARKVPILLVSLFLVTGTLDAQHAPRTTVTGLQVKQRTDEVMQGYDWGRTLDDLKARAKKERKLIFWVQIVGDLDRGL